MTAADASDGGGAGEGREGTEGRNPDGAPPNRSEMNIPKSSGHVAMCVISFALSYLAQHAQVLPFLIRNMATQ